MESQKSRKKQVKSGRWPCSVCRKGVGKMQLDAQNVRSGFIRNVVALRTNWRSLKTYLCAGFVGWIRGGL